MLPYERLRLSIRGAALMLETGSKAAAELQDPVLAGQLERKAAALEKFWASKFRTGEVPPPRRKPKRRRR